MEDRRYIYALAAIFVLALALRLYFAFGTDQFSLDAYVGYRQVDSIRNTLLPSYVDDLSYSGRTHIFPPVYYYVLAGFSFFIGTALSLKIIPNLFACTIIIIIYLLVLELTKSRKISIFCAFTSAFIPVFFSNTLNSASSLSFTIPLTFYLFYCFLRIKEKRFLYHFLVFSFVLSLTSPISFLFIFAILIYLLLIKLEYRQENRLELEVILFVTFMTLWVNVLIYKNAFLFHSYNLIWQNIPSQVLSEYFKSVDIVSSVTSIGLLPLLLGIFAVYRYMFQEKDKRTYLLMAAALAVAFLLWAKLIDLVTGLMFLGAILVPLFGQSLKLFFDYVEKTKISDYADLFWIPLAILVVITSVASSIVAASVVMTDSVSPGEYKALLWMRDNTEKDSVVLSTLSEGDLITAIAERKNVADSDFILIRSSDIIFDDVKQMYTAILKTSAAEVLDKYGVNYIYLSSRAAGEFNISSLRYADGDCFRPVYDEGVKIYQVSCGIGK